jgi:UDP-glucose 4-epimerase
MGEFPSKFADNIMPALTETASGKRKELLVYGNTYNTYDGSCIRDYIDIMDLANAHICSVNRMLKNEILSNMEVFNIGTGKGTSVLELISSFEKITGNEMRFRIVDSREGDVEKIYADPTLANSVLGWKSKRSLDESVRTSWDWQQNLN